MKRCTLHLILAWLLLTAAGGYALDTQALLQGTPAARILNKKCLRTSIAGIIPAAHEDVVLYLDQPRLIPRLQRSYSTPTGGGPSIIERSPGSYYYVNKNESRTEIYERFCRATADDTYDLILQAYGKRFFGSYDVIIHIQFIDTQMKSTTYTAEVYAFPRNMALRFFARRLGIVERYFKKNTPFIARIAQRVAAEINASAVLPSTWIQPTLQPDNHPAAYLMRRK